MYAIFEDGSRQYRVESDSRVVLDYREAAVGSTIELPKVLLLGGDGAAVVGQPLVEGARVLAEVVGLPRKKTVIQKFRRRKNYRRLKGHTQPYIEVRVRHILKAGEQPPASPPPAPAEQPAAPAPTT